VTGRISEIAVTWTVETPAGPKHVLVDLTDLRKYCREERVDDLLDDLTVLCGDVQDAREGRLRVVR